MLGNRAQRPANRFTGFAAIEYRRTSDGKTTTDTPTAYRWYNCGDCVVISQINYVFKMTRNSAHMTETATGRVIARVKRKDGVLWDSKLSNKIARIQGKQIDFNLF